MFHYSKVGEKLALRKCNSVSLVKSVLKIDSTNILQAIFKKTMFLNSSIKRNYEKQKEHEYLQGLQMMGVFVQLLFNDVHLLSFAPDRWNMFQQYSYQMVVFHGGKIPMVA